MIRSNSLVMLHEMLGSNNCALAVGVEQSILQSIYFAKQVLQKHFAKARNG